MELAAENGIRKAESIIREVGNAIMEFCALAEQNGVREQWISAIENTLNVNLESWGLINAKSVKCYLDADGRQIENARLEQQYKGNYHLLATIDGKERKYVIRKKTVEHDEISRMVTANLPDGYIKELVSKYLL